MPDSSQPDLTAQLARFGMEAFRPGQEDVIRTVLQGRDCLCIMPTGGGKSLCYQLPSIARPGVTLVISPLIALMKDQVDGLRQLEIPATYVNSSLSWPDQCERLQLMSEGQFDLVYVAPERLRNAHFLDALRGVDLQLLAIDEAHCVSQWGHDFRPDYARLGVFRERLGFPPTIALTATATPHVRRDVAELLKLREPHTFITGFSRPNLHFQVYSSGGHFDKQQQLCSLLKQHDGAGIIYGATRKRCEEIAESLSEALHAAGDSRKVGIYHAGLLPEERKAVQDRFMQDHVQIIVATNAFGMGIDKPDLRFVIHYAIPGSLEAYYQEAGRAGRDGNASTCALLYNGSDRRLQEFFIESAYPSREVIQKVYDFLRGLPQDPIELTLQEIKDELGLSVGTEAVGACETILQRCGALERLSTQENLASVRIRSGLVTLVDLVPKEARSQRKVLRALEQIVQERRDERVFFHPRELAQRSEMQHESILRAIRELTKLDQIDYVPPFRGRAVHVTRRDVPFSRLEIDFEELDRRKAAEYDKLAAVIRYAQCRRCRQLEIVDYFGDPHRQACATCDNCLSRSEGSPDDPPAQPASEHILEPIRMALSGIARTHGRFGKTLVAKMLTGSKSTQVKKVQLHRLSTFGLLSYLKQTEAVELIDALIAVGMVSQTEIQRFRPIVQLTDQGRDVMKGRSAIPSRLPVRQALLAKLLERATLASPPAARSIRSAEPGSLADTPRQDQTRPDDSLPEESVPADSRETDSMTRFDPPHRQLSEAEPDEQPADSGDLPTDINRATGGEDDPRRQPTHYWTWRLLSDGYSFEQCQQIRALDEQAMLDHLVIAAEQGWRIEPSWLAGRTPAGSGQQPVVSDAARGPLR